MAKATYRVVPQKDTSFAVEIMTDGDLQTIPGFFSELEADAWVQQHSTETTKLAKRMVDVATGEASDRKLAPEERAKAAAAAASGRGDGPKERKARAASMTPERRAETPDAPAPNGGRSRTKGR